MPFDNGFFPPCAIASVLRNPKINLKYNDNHLTHSVCIKYENYSDPISGNGIKFQKSSYEEIDSLAMSRDMRGINKYLDDTFGYYTLDIEHNFVLAHYNWHKFSDRTEVHDHSINLEKINRTLNKRIRIMLERCSIANYIFFIVEEFQDYQYMMIDNQSMDLHCFDELVNTAESLFNAQCVVSKIDHVDSAEKLLAMIN